MISGPSGHDHDPQKPLFLTSGPPTYFNKKQEQGQTIFEKYHFRKFHNLESLFFGKAHVTSILEQGLVNS